MTSYHPAKSFLGSEDGSATPLAIGFSVIFIVLGGLAVDFNKAVGERTQLQMATDSAAHAALYSWEFEDTQVSTDAAQAAIAGMLPDIAYRDALQNTDYAYGYWDPTTDLFVEDATFIEADLDPDDPRVAAVRVNAELEPERDNESRNIFLSIVGQDTFTIRATTTYANYYPFCFKEGFVAEDVVDLQSGSTFTDGFCVHSNTHVSLNQNNFFEPGTVVSMPNTDNLDIPESGFEKNEGLEAALRSGEYRMRLLRQMPRMFASLRNGSPDYAEVAGVTENLGVLWPMVKGNGANGEYAEIKFSDSGKKTFDPGQSFPTKHRIYQANCSGNGDITFTAGHYRDFVLVTDCEINFANGVILDGVLIATEGDVNSSHVQLGLDDNCTPGGGASIWTYGTFQTVSDLEAYGSQILALGDIYFTANGNGIEGVSFIALGRIEGTSSGEMGYCDGEGVEHFAKAPYFRMVN